MKDFPSGILVPYAGLRFTSAAHAAAAFADETRSTYFYHRYGHYNPDLFARAAASLDQAEDGIACASGMAAITALTTAFVRPYEWMVSSARIYGGTYPLFANILPEERVVRTRFVANPRNLAEWEEKLASVERGRLKLVFLESPGNPMLEVYDIAAIAELAHRFGAPLVVDNTVATPALQQPLQFGADLVVYSATKYLTQGLLLSGVIAGTKDLIAKIRETVGVYGLNLGAFESWFGTTAMPHLALRMKQHSDNAWALALALAAHPAVKAMHYPGFQNMQERALVRKQMSGFGSGLLSFEVKGGRRAAWRVMNGLVKNGTAEIVPHLGELGTMAIHPASTTHAKLMPAQREAAGITEGLIRVSVGIEPSEKIIAGFTDALSIIALY